MVKVKMSGDLQLQGIEIAPEAIDPDDPELRQDMAEASAWMRAELARRRAMKK